MKKHDIRPFGYARMASGLQGFFGEGYRFHLLPLKMLWLWFWGLTFVSKTATIPPRAGNMPLDGTLRPVEWLPKCICISFWLWLQGAMLNAVGLSNPGLLRLLSYDKWQERKKRFMISVMPVGGSKDDRLWEMREVVRMLRNHWCFVAPLALQLNITCPNTGHGLSDIAAEVLEYLDILSALGIPIEVKINALFPIELAKKIAEHTACSGLSVSNTIPFGDAPERIDWKKLFGTNNPKESPLAKRGFPAGGLSGKHVLPLNLAWAKQARAEGISCPLDCGSCFGPIAVLRAFLAGFDSVSVGTVDILRPWMVPFVTLTAHVLGPIFSYLRQKEPMPD